MARWQIVVKTSEATKQTKDQNVNKKQTMAIWGEITAIVLLRRNYCYEHFAAKSLCHMRFAETPLPWSFEITAMNALRKNHSAVSAFRRNHSAMCVLRRHHCHVRFAER